MSLFVLSIFLIVFSRFACSEDTEIILLPLWDAEKTMEVPLRFKAFGQSVDLMLRRNDEIVASGFEAWKYNFNGVEKKSTRLRPPSPCHYLHRNDMSTAAISLCDENGMQGFVFLDNATLEITPMQKSHTLNGYRDIGKRSLSFGDRHVVKRVKLPPMDFKDKMSYLKHNKKIQPIETKDKLEFRQFQGHLTLELAIFFDEAAYKLFRPFFASDNELNNMILAYTNNIQAILHHPSLGQSIDLALIRLELFQTQPRNLPTYEGERASLLRSFCNYAINKNPRSDFDPGHWDLGLYISGLNFYSVENGRRDDGTMGFAYLDGICYEDISCGIVEFGITDNYGQPYPSVGIASVYIAIHEIGHTLGMEHDSEGNTCPPNGFIMSAIRTHKGETTWSGCSRDVAQKLSFRKPCLQDKPSRPPPGYLNHAYFGDKPGRTWNAKKQCEIFFRDKDAYASQLDQICGALHCQTPHKSGFFFAGPALDGTCCGPNKECAAGYCLDIWQTLRPRASWSNSKTRDCSSGCIEKSKGFQPRGRSCKSASSKDTREDTCHEVHLCNDDSLCTENRQNASNYAALQCEAFGKRLPEIDAKGGGRQAKHEPARPWMACSIFCLVKDLALYYTPRMELNDLGFDPFFPDGTWCYSQGGHDYFCRQHHCLPEDFRYGKTFSASQLDENIALENARSGQYRVEDSIDGQPLLSSLPSGINPSKEY